MPALRQAPEDSIPVECECNGDGWFWDEPYGIVVCADHEEVFAQAVRDGRKFWMCDACAHLTFSAHPQCESCGSIKTHQYRKGESSRRDEIIENLWVWTKNTPGMPNMHVLMSHQLLTRLKEIAPMAFVDCDGSCESSLPNSPTEIVCAAHYDEAAVMKAIRERGG